MLFSNEEKSSKIIIDSGASNHISNTRQLTPVNNVKITVGNGQILKVKSKGTICIPLRYNKNPTKLILRVVFYVPEIVINLISISALTKQKYTTVFYGDNCFISRHKRRC